MKDKFWDNLSKNYDDNIKKRNHEFQKTIAAIKPWIHPLGSILDYGCATGEHTIEIATMSSFTAGIDISPKMIEIAQQKAVDRKVINAEFIVADIFSQQFEPQSFDTIIALHILHLVNDIPKVLDALHRLLKPDGSLILLVPCVGEWNVLLRSLMYLGGQAGLMPKIHQLKINDWENILQNQQFEIIESKAWNKQNKIQWLVTKK